MEYTKLDRSVSKIYARRIMRGDITIEDVPERIRDLVSELVKA